MALLEVTRRKDFSAVFRKMKIEVDGALVLELPRGSTAAVHVDAGSHEVVARMDWERSAPLEVTCTDAEPTRVEVVTISPVGALWALLSRRKLFEVRQLR